MRRRSLISFSACAIAAAVALVAACGDSTTGDTEQPDAAPSSTPPKLVAPPTTPTATTTSTPSKNDAAPAVDADTGPTDPVRFVAIGDQGKGCAGGPTDGQCKVAAGIKTKCDKDGCDFALMLGDNFYPSGAATVDDPVFQTYFEQPYANLNFPFYVVLGNHDYGSNGAGLDFARGQVEVDYTQKSTKWKMPAKVYRQVFSNVEFFALDTHQIMLGNDTDQRKDVASWLSASKAKWKIGFGHHPYLSNGPHGNAGNYDGLGFLPGIIPAAGKNIKSFMDDIVCGKADLYFSGHDHSRQWMTGTCAGTELAVSGAGASTTELKGSNATRFQKDTIGFLYISIVGKTLTAEFLDAAGTVEFTRTLTK